MSGGSYHPDCTVDSGGFGEPFFAFAHCNALVNEKTNAYFRDTITKTPEDCTYVASNLIGFAIL